MRKSLFPIGVLILITTIAALNAGCGGGSAVAPLSFANQTQKPTPTSTPTLGPVQLSPDTVSLYCNEAKFTAAQSNYTGMFTAVSADTKIAQVKPTSPVGTFIVGAATLVGGTTTITVTGGDGAEATEYVSVGTCLGGG
jgi:hypothetical protein